MITNYKGDKIEYAFPGDIVEI